MTPEELKELLLQYEEAYYNREEELVTDEEYNALVKKYLELTGQDEYNFVPGKIEQGKRIKHPYPIISLAKVQITDKETIRKELERLWPVSIQWKLDGATLMFYNNDNHKTSISRGDGEYGEDKTEYIPYIKNVGDIPINSSVRCEAVITKQDFKAINGRLILKGEEPFKNARNALSGMLNRKITKDNFPEGISVIAYNMNGHTNGDKEELELLKKNGWNIVPTYYPESIEDAIKYIKEFDFNNKDITVDIDGLVVKHVGTKDFGSTEHHPLNAFAVKPETPKIWTRLKHVEWSVGKTGLVVPTAIFKSIDILGSTVSRATLHNIAYIKALEIDKYIYPDTTVQVTKANMITPAIVGYQRHNKDFNIGTKNVIGRIVIPTKCPECGSELVKVKDQLYCRNNSCKEKIIAQAINMVNRNGLDIIGLSEETIRKMYDLKIKDNSTFTFCLNWSKKELLLIDGYAEKSANNLLKEYEKLKCIKFSKFLYSCNIPLLGKKASKLIANNFKTLEEFYTDIKDNNGEKLLTIDGCGPTLYNSIKDNLNNIDNLIVYINQLEYQYEEPKIKKENQLTFVITGSLEQPRKYYQDLIENAGHKLSGSVSKKTNYVVCEEKDSNSSKIKKAKELNIQIINIKELIDILNK